MISTDQLSTFLYCKRKLFLEDVLKINKPKRRDVMRNMILNRSQVSVNSEEEHIISGIRMPMELQEIKGLYKKEYSRIVMRHIQENREMLNKIGLMPGFVHSWVMKRLETELLYRSLNVFEFMKKTGLVSEKLWHELTPKIKSDYYISSVALGLSSTIDILEIYPTKIYPVLIKAGRAPDKGVWPGHQITIAAQIMLLEEQYKMGLTTGGVRYLEPGICRDVILNPFLRDHVFTKADDVKQILRLRSLPSRVDNVRKCKACELYEQCYNKEYMEISMQEFNRKV